MNTHRVRAYFLLLIVAFIWGIAGPVIKLTLKGLPVDIFLVYRFFMASILALIIIFIKKFKLPKDPAIVRDIIIYSLLNSTVTLGLLFWGLEKTSLLDMSILSLFGPILMILAGFVFLREHITARERVGIVITFAGSVLVTVEPILKADHGTSAFFGNFLIITSLISGALAGLYVKKLMRQGVSPSFLANLSFILGFVTLFPFVLFKSGFSQTIGTIANAPFPYHLGVVYMAFISGTLAYSLYNLAQKTIELSEAALFSYLYPIFSGILAVFVLGDKFTLPIAVGSAAAFIGVFLAKFKKKRVS